MHYTFRNLLILLWFSCSAFGACTIITGTLTLADTTPYSGTLNISWPVPWIASDGTVLPSGPPVNYSVVNGVVNICLEPTTGSTPLNITYSVTYRPALTGASPEIWAVPSPGPTTITSVRQPAPAPTPLAVIALSQLATSGASSGQGICFVGGVWTNGNCGNGFTSPMTTLGDLIYENATPGPARLAGSTSASQMVLTQTGTGVISAAPAWGQATEAAMSFSDVTTLNSTTGRHGFLPKLDGTATDCLIGTGVFAPCPSANAVSSVFGRIGAVVSAVADYSAAQVTNAVSTIAGNTGAAGMTLNMAASTSAAALRMPNIAGASSTTAGAISYDTTNKGIHAGANGVDNTLGLLPSSITPANNDCSKFTVASSVITLNTAGGPCGVTSNPLSQFAATTSAQLAGVLSDETGTGFAVFSAAPTLTGLTKVAGTASTATTFTMTGCSATTPVGGATAGTYTSGTTGTCTVVITLNGATGLTAPNGWHCSASDQTTPADIQQTTASNPTTATISGTTMSGDVISFHCMGY